MQYYVTMYIVMVPSSFHVKTFPSIIKKAWQARIHFVTLETLYVFTFYYTIIGGGGVI